MDFKQWLLESEESPYQQWHRDYENFWKSNSRWRRREVDPGASIRDEKELFRDPNSQWVVAEVLRVRGYSAGLHSFGPDQRNVPADNPLLNAAWEYEIESSEQEEALKGKPAFISDHGWGSFHEQQADLRVYVIINDDWQAQELVHWGRFNKRDQRKVRKWFAFESVRQAAQEIMELDDAVKNPVKDGEDREAYWNRMIRQAGIDPDERDRHPDDTYDPSDDYYKRR